MHSVLGLNKEIMKQRNKVHLVIFKRGCLQHWPSSNSCARHSGQQCAEAQEPGGARGVLLERGREYLALILQKKHGLSQCFVENLIASGGSAPWTPIKVLINTHFYMFGAIADPARSASPPNLADLPSPLMCHFQQA